MSDQDTIEALLFDLSAALGELDDALVERDLLREALQFIERESTESWIVNTATRALDVVPPRDEKEGGGRSE